MPYDLGSIPGYYCNKFINSRMEDGSVLTVAGIETGGQFTALYYVVSSAVAALTDGPTYMLAAGADMKAH